MGTMVMGSREGAQLVPQPLHSREVVYFAARLGQVQTRQPVFPVHFLCGDQSAP